MYLMFMHDMLLSGRWTEKESVKQRIMDSVLDLPIVFDYFEQY